jgi:hypothetical protein
MAEKRKTASDMEALFAAVCNEMKAGLSARKACKKVGMSQESFYTYAAKPHLLEQYARAREALLEYWAEDAMEIADEPVATTANGSYDSAAVAKQKLQIDTRKWFLSKLAPKKYGDKVENTVVGDADRPVHKAITINLVKADSSE